MRTDSQILSPGHAPRRGRRQMRSLSGDRIVIDAWERSDGARVHRTVIRDTAGSSTPIHICRNVTSSDGRILETIIATLAGAKRGEGIASRSWFEGDADRVDLGVYETYGPGRTLTRRRVRIADARTCTSIRIEHVVGGETLVEIEPGRAIDDDLDALVERAHLLAITALRDV